MFINTKWSHYGRLQLEKYSFESFFLLQNTIFRSIEIIFSDENQFVGNISDWIWCLIEWLNCSDLRRCYCGNINLSKLLNHNSMCLSQWKHHSCGEHFQYCPVIFELERAPASWLRHPIQRCSGGECRKSLNRTKVIQSQFDTATNNIIFRDLFHTKRKIGWNIT